MNDSIPGNPIPSATSPPLWEVYAQLCDDPLFRLRVGWRHHELVVRHLARAACPRLAALELRQIVAHHLFGTARRAGRRNALARVPQTLGLLRANALPTADGVTSQAPALEDRHLGRFEPRRREVLHQWVLRRASTLRRAFFEPKRGSQSNALWGERFVSAPGRDWYQQCLAMMSKGSVRAVCHKPLSEIELQMICIAL